MQYLSTTVYRYYIKRLVTSAAAVVGGRKSAIQVNVDFRNPRTQTNGNFRDPRTQTRGMFRDPRTQTNGDFLTIKEVV
jgi:hypothetical protein